MDWKKLVEILKGHKVYIQTHNYPDPDAMASGLGLQVFLKQHGVESTMCYDGKIEKLSTKRMLDVFQFEIYNIEDILDMSATDYIVTVDAQKFNANITDFIGNEVACIDHHPTFIQCEYQYKDIRLVGACATLVAQYFKESGTPIDSNTATALLYGMKIDTDSWSRGVTLLDIQMFEYLFPYIDEEKMKLMNKSSMDALVGMVSDFILDLDVVEFAVVYAKREDGLKFSIRSELKYLNAGEITAKALNGIGTGGGHAAMAGGFVPIEMVEKFGYLYDDEIQQRFVTVCKERERENNK